MSDTVVATRGIVAGSRTATTEMRLAIIDIIDRAVEEYSSVDPTLYVDDASAEVAGPDEWVEKQLVGSMRMICQGITDAGMETSPTKSVCTASSPSLTAKIAAKLADFGILPVIRTKSLGFGMAAGVRRNAMVINR